MVASALASGQVHLLVSRGVDERLIYQEDVKAVLGWAVDFSRRYGQAPSGPILRERFPEWRGEISYDPLDALVDQFLQNTKRRYFEAAVVELSEMPKSPQYVEQWGRLDEIFLEKARELATIVPSGRVARFSADLEQRIERYEEEKGHYRPGIPLGIPVIDQAMQGIRPGWLVTTAGYSGLGKSSLASHCSLSAFEDDATVLFCSLEMSSQEVLERLDTMVMNWRHSDLMRRNLSDVEMQRWRDVARVYSKSKGEIIVLDKLSGCSIDRVHAEIERYQPQVTVLDYVQRMRSMYASKKPKWEQLEEITNDLKTIAMDTDTAVVMVSQDNRASAEQGSTSTNMGGSISVFQAADAYVGMMQDEAMYALGKMRIKLLKFRHGPRAEVDVRWDPSVGDFCELWKSSDEFVKTPAVPA